MIYYVEIYTVGNNPRLIDKWAINECDINIRQAVNNIISRNIRNNKDLEVQYNIRIKYLKLSCSLTARMPLRDLCAAFKISPLRMKEIKKEKVVSAREEIKSLITVGQSMVDTFWFNRPRKDKSFILDAMSLIHDLKSMFEQIIDSVYNLWDTKNYIYYEVTNVAKNMLTEFDNYSKDIQTEYASTAVLNDACIAMADILKILRSEAE